MTDNQEDLRKRYEKLKEKYEPILNRKEDFENLQQEYDKYMRQEQSASAIQLLLFLESVAREDSTKTQ